MPDEKIHYAIIALTKNEAIEIISILKAKGNTTIANCLEKNIEKSYGNLPDDWKPFYDERITDIIEKNTNEYKNETQLISCINEECTNLNLTNVWIFFIDMFAIYTDKYIKLAGHFNDLYHNTRDGHLCFMINCMLPVEVQNELEKTYRKNFPTVSERYEQGFLHRIAVRIDDVHNFKNYLKDILKMKQQVDKQPPNPMVFLHLALVSTDLSG